MIKKTDFKVWLDNNTSYTSATKSDIISRLKRADRIIPLENTSIYLYILSQHPDFQNLGVSVRSQIKKAVKIYFEFIESEGRIVSNG